MKHSHTIESHPVPRETFEATDRLLEDHEPTLEQYIDRLFWWNERVNLVSRSVSRETIWKHIRHSLLLTQFDPLHNSGRVVDAGTGGGLPGIPLAVVYPDKQFVLNDRVSKKILAVKQMVNTLELQNITVFDGSIARYSSPEPYLLITKHAFKVGQLWEMVRHHPWTTMAFYKGVEFEDELQGIAEPLQIQVWDLGPRSDDPFFRGKGLLFISRT
ncbi:MAG: RsmG family class I SAM-dependent methyltransferase [Balneolaceae bacterium]|nr:RsmG family class I SAM-dependent methyltransferase [Balneolaceae bacterium]